MHRLDYFFVESIECTLYCKFIRRSAVMVHFRMPECSYVRFKISKIIRAIQWRLELHHLISSSNQRVLWGDLCLNSSPITMLIGSHLLPKMYEECKEINIWKVSLNCKEENHRPKPYSKYLHPSIIPDSKMWSFILLLTTDS